MAHFVKIENNIVTNGIVINNDVCGEPTLIFPDTDSAGRAYIANTLKFDGVWKQTSFNNNFRKQFCGVGFTFDSVKDQFVAPKQFASWTLDNNNDWQPPTPMPLTGGPYRWTEEELVWVAI